MASLLIIGNLGYVGSVLTTYIRGINKDITLVGLDTGYFANKITSTISPDVALDKQIYKDIRNLRAEDLAGYDFIILLAALSNDPIGNEFEECTKSINNIASLKIASLAAESGCKRFVFASSCSIYGLGDNAPRQEDADLNPLTAYAKSKVEVENGLRSISKTAQMEIMILRFATACGFSSRLRTDLVLNDFVMNAVVNKKIEVKSNGEPWRPLIDVEDMARALYWASTTAKPKNNITILNAGSTESNYTIKNIAEKVKEMIPEAELTINENADKDNRSYRVDFSKFEAMVDEEFKPQITLENSVKNLIKGISQLKSGYTIESGKRLVQLKHLISENLLDKNLYWEKK